MRVLVTGHNGYIGSVMVPMLIDAGHEVAGIDSDLFAGQAFIYGEGPAETPSQSMDIRDIRAADLAGFDAIVHLAALSNDPLGDINPDMTFEINHLATVQLAELAKEQGVKRFIFSSSCSNYGASTESWLDEDSEPGPVTPYAASKIEAERDLANLADDSFSPVFLRNATAYGVSPYLRLDLVLNDLVGWAFTAGRVYLKSDGLSWRPLIHVKDISRAFLAVLRTPRWLVHNQTFNVGQTGENYQIRDLAEMVAEMVPDSHVEYADDASPDKRSYRVRCDKIVNALPEFKPTWTVTRGAEELYEAYKAANLRRADLEGTRYRRLDYLKHLMQSGRVDETLRWRGRVPV